MGKTTGNKLFAPPFQYETGGRMLLQKVGNPPPRQIEGVVPEKTEAPNSSHSTTRHQELVAVSDIDNDPEDHNRILHNTNSKNHVPC